MKLFHASKQLWSNKYNLVWLGFAVISIAMAVATVDQIEINNRLERQAQQLGEEIELLQQQIANQNLENEFLATESFLELEAKRLGLVEEGASLLILNRKLIEATAANYRLPVEEPESASQPLTPFEYWVDFFNGPES